MRIRKYNVDLLKAIAIVMVVGCHSAQKITGLSVHIENVSKLGQLGVQIFFVMSAYLCCITTKKMNLKETKRFLTKKFLRIAPAYWFAIVFYQLLLRIVMLLELPVRIYTDTNLLNCLLNFTLLNNLFPNACNTIVPGGGSISCLWIFFLLCPFIFRVQKNFSRALLGYLFSCIIMLVYGLVIIFGLGMKVENNSYLYFNFISQLPCFMTGILMFYSEKEQEKLKKCQIIGGFLAFAFMTVYLFFSDNSVAYIILPCCTSSTVLFAYFWLQQYECNIKEISGIINVSNMTLSIFVIHPLFAYYGISYMYKIFERFNINTNANLVYIVATIVVFLCSYYVSKMLNPIFMIPLNFYCNKKYNGEKI